MKKIMRDFVFLVLLFSLGVVPAGASPVNVDPERLRALFYLDGFDRYVEACDNRDASAAKEVLDWLVEGYPDEIYLYYLRALMLFDLQDYAGSRTDLDYYLQYEPQDIGAYKMNARACMEDGADEDAYYYCQRGLALNPGNTYLLQWERELQQRIAARRERESFERTNSGDETYEMQQILQFINEKRQDAGLQPLAMNAALNDAAQKRAEELIDSFSHTRPDGTPFLSVMKEFDIPYHFAGEAVYKRSGSITGVIADWRKMYEDKDFGIDPNTRYVGIGCVENDGVSYLAQIFMF